MEVSWLVTRSFVALMLLKCVDINIHIFVYFIVRYSSILVFSVSPPYYRTNFQPVHSGDAQEEQRQRWERPFSLVPLRFVLLHCHLLSGCFLHRFLPLPLHGAFFQTVAFPFPSFLSSPLTCLFIISCNIPRARRPWIFLSLHRINRVELIVVVNG